MKVYNIKDFKKRKYTREERRSEDLEDDGFGVKNVFLSLFFVLCVFLVSAVFLFYLGQLKKINENDIRKIVIEEMNNVRT